MNQSDEQRRQRCADAMREHGDAVYRLAFARCRSTADAEDIFQTTFLRYFAANRVYNDAEHEKAWLLRVCINACKDLQKSAWRTKVGAMPENYDTPDISATAQDASPQEEAIECAMQALSPDQRTVVHLHYFEDMSTGAIAQMLDMRPATVRSHLHRARIAMRSTLGDAGLVRKPRQTSVTNNEPEDSPSSKAACTGSLALKDVPDHFRTASSPERGQR